MPTSFTFDTTAADHVTELMLEQAAALFSNAYGIWGPDAEQHMGKFCKPGKRVRMTVQRLREQCLPPGTNSVLVRGMAGDILAGYAFATRWVYEGRQICWVTQLCVNHEYRGKRLATQVCASKCSSYFACVSENDEGFGILSSHPAAILGALRAWGRGIEEVSLDMAREHGAGIMAASPVQYVRDAKLKGSVFGIEDGTVCCADTNFWVDHAEPLAALAEVKKRTAWPFGELPEGCEFLVLIKGAEVNEEGQRVRRKQETSDF